MYDFRDLHCYLKYRIKKITEKYENAIISYNQTIQRCANEYKENLEFLKTYSNYNPDKSLRANVEAGFKFHATIPEQFSEKHHRLSTLRKNTRYAIDKIKDARRRTEYAQGLLFPTSEFLAILRLFNEKLVDLMIKEGLVYPMPHRLGLLFIERAKRIRPKVDWGTSNKNKAAILERGGTPYSKENAPHGEKWLVYHDQDYDHRFQWTHSAVLNKNFYTFFPTVGEDGNVRKMVHYIKNNPLVVHKYNYRENKKQN